MTIYDVDSIIGIKLSRRDMIHFMYLFSDHFKKNIDNIINKSIDINNHHNIYFNILKNVVPIKGLNDMIINYCGIGIDYIFDNYSNSIYEEEMKLKYDYNFLAEWKEEKLKIYRKKYSSYNDVEHLKIYHITHDVDDNEPYVIGCRLNCTNGESSLSNIINQFNYVKKLVKNIGLIDDVNLYKIQDGCYCCS